MKSRILRIVSLIAVSCAWFFAIATILSLILIIVIDFNKPDAVGRIMSTGDGINIKSAWGLTYAGRTGHLLAALQIILIAAALWASTSGFSSIRRIGLIALVAWAGLWTLNAFYVFPDGEFLLVFQTVFFFICTFARTFTRWSVNSNSQPETD